MTKHLYAIAVRKRNFCSSVSFSFCLPWLLFVFTGRQSFVRWKATFLFQSELNVWILQSGSLSLGFVFYFWMIYECFFLSLNGKKTVPFNGFAFHATFSTMLIGGGNSWQCRSYCIQCWWSEEEAFGNFIQSGERSKYVCFLMFPKKFYCFPCNAHLFH